MPTRREILSGQTIREAARITDETAGVSAGFIVSAVETIRLGTVAMASDFELILTAGPVSRLSRASTALDLVNQLEDQLSVYRPWSELSKINARAAHEPVVVESRLFNLLVQAVSFAKQTDGAFDPTAGPVVALWQTCRQERRLPTAPELDLARERVGWHQVKFDHEHRTVRFARPGVGLNLNAMGKGYALDRAAEILSATGEADSAASEKAKQLAHESVQAGAPDATGESPRLADWLIHGGFSSILARGSHQAAGGWRVGIRHPLFPDKTLGTLCLRDRGLSTSGSGVQFFRHAGKRYGHIIDPRTGWPAEGMLSVSVLAPTAAEAEALSTGFFANGVEKACEYCHNHPEIAALLIPAPKRGKRLEPILCSIPESDLSLTFQD